jgi:NADP-dependent 3-hydroxy acid dehydrogenase YdfG
MSRREFTLGSESRQLAVVTGGGSGLGRAIALRLAENQFDVALIGRNLTSLNSVADEIRSRGSDAMPIRCDVSNWSEVSKAFQSIGNQRGKIDVLVNNAGGWLNGTVIDSDPEQFLNLLESSVAGVFLVTKAAVPLMPTGSTIVNIGSTSGLPGSRDNSVSSTPKGAVNVFSETAAREVAERGVRLSVVNPASVDKFAPYDSTPEKNDEGQFVKLGQAQVADIVLYVISQPVNVCIREVVVVPLNTKR